MLFIGIKKGDSDEKITEMAERAYDYFDDGIRPPACTW
jgi:hypothetical protein